VAFDALQKVIEVRAEFIDADVTAAQGGAANAKYAVKSDCYRQALERARMHGAAVFLLNADIVLADGFVRSAVELLCEGRRAIEVCGPRGLRGPIGEALTSRHRSADGVSIAIDALELSALWLRHMHPLLQMHFVEGPDGAPFHPSHLYWKVGEEGILARCFHLYPIVVYPKDARISFTTTIDNDLVGNLGLNEDERFIAQDSREIFCCELSAPGQDVGGMARRGDLNGYVEFYVSYGERNLANLEKEIVITATRELGRQWASVSHQSGLVIEQLLKIYRDSRIRRLAGALLERCLGTLRKSVPSPIRGALKRARAAMARRLSRSRSR
jgi:hypothetical protein